MCSQPLTLQLLFYKTISNKNIKMPTGVDQIHPNILNTAAVVITVLFASSFNSSTRLILVPYTVEFQPKVTSQQQPSLYTASFQYPQSADLLYT